MFPQPPLSALGNSPSRPTELTLKRSPDFSPRSRLGRAHARLQAGTHLMPGVHSWQQGPPRHDKPGSQLCVEDTLNLKAASRHPSSPRSSIASGSSTQTLQYAQCAGPSAPRPQPSSSQLTQSYSQPQGQPDRWPSCQSPHPPLDPQHPRTQSFSSCPWLSLPPIRTSLPEPCPPAPTHAKRHRVDAAAPVHLQNPFILQLHRALQRAHQHVQRANMALSLAPLVGPPPLEDSDQEEDILIAGPEVMRADVNIWRGGF